MVPFLGNEISIGIFSQATCYCCTIKLIPLIILLRNGFKTLYTRSDTLVKDYHIRVFLHRMYMPIFYPCKHCQFLLIDLILKPDVRDNLIIYRCPFCYSHITGIKFKHLNILGPPGSYVIAIVNQPKYFGSSCKNVLPLPCPSYTAKYSNVFNDYNALQ